MATHIAEPEGHRVSLSTEHGAQIAYVLGMLKGVLDEEGISAELVPSSYPSQLIVRIPIIGDYPFMLTLHRLVPT